MRVTRRQPGIGLVRRELCSEAIRLARTLCRLLPDEAENLGLLALMLLHDSRRDARTDKQGRLIVWKSRIARSRTKRIREGHKLVHKALGMRRLGPYELQAAISAVLACGNGCGNRLAEDGSISELMRISPSPMVALNHAVAVAMSEGLQIGLKLVEQAGETGELRRDSIFFMRRERTFCDDSAGEQKRRQRIRGGIAPGDEWRGERVSETETGRSIRPRINANEHESVT